MQHVNVNIPTQTVQGSDLGRAGLPAHISGLLIAGQELVFLVVDFQGKSLVVTEQDVKFNPRTLRFPLIPDAASDGNMTPIAALTIRQ